MKLTANETLFLTALAREQNQTGCKGPAHDLLRQHAYADTHTTGPGSLAFSYESVPLTSLLVKDCRDLQDIDDFLRKEKPLTQFGWPWSSEQEFRSRLAEARSYWQNRKVVPNNGQDASGLVGLIRIGDSSSAGWIDEDGGCPFPTLFIASSGRPLSELLPSPQEHYQWENLP